MRKRPDIDPGAIAAVAWVLVAVGVTVVFGPRLGLRGLAWLGVHHLLCLVGVAHEYTRYRRRQALRASASAPEASGASASGPPPTAAAPADPGG